ncbi:four-carbon acid sugar kinase family protein [Halobacillus sp. Marseille-P3879]|uniref:four-carbon acid sugar kinase family protein n=1 Tax=Halobacillus sp. Marseille-P3879 TaxID=2045014 RepID=UPI000C7CDB1E|nr:four-carbon acid sugar kinase family protein [Halobacillus sp. Marseille-P3879]
MNFKFGMIADDLTGANDSGIQLKEKGLSTSVYFEIPADQKSLDEAIVIDTDSRALNREAAYEATKAAAEFLAQAGYTNIYKKMDSTLRGYIGLELQAVDEVFDPSFIVVAPAFPPYGRTTENGIHLLHGEPVSETELAIDPKHPVSESHLPTLIEEETGKKTALINEKVLNQDVDDWLKTIDRLQKKNVKYLICDANTERELRAMAEKINSLSLNIVWAGSAGLAEVLPNVLRIDQSTNSKDKCEQKGSVLTVCGSLSKTTQDQAAYAMKQPGIQNVMVDTEKIFSDEWQRFADEYYNSSMEAVKKGKDVVLYVPSNLDIRKRVKQRAVELGLSPFEMGKKISEALGQITRRVVNEVSLSALVLTGGDTAKDVVKSLGATGLRLDYQLEAGIPVGTPIGVEPAIPIVTKAGAFGNESSIYHAMEKMKGAVRK